jgi:hypothetical protein
MIPLGNQNTLDPDAIAEADIWIYFEKVAKEHFGDSTTLANREIRDRVHFAVAHTDTGDRILGAKVTNVVITEAVTVLTEEMLAEGRVACPDAILASAPADCSEKVRLWRMGSHAYNEGALQFGGRIKMDTLILAGACYKTAQGTMVRLLRYKGGNKYLVEDAGAYFGKKVAIDRHALLELRPTLVPDAKSLSPLHAPYAPNVIAAGKFLIGQNEWGGNTLVGRVATASDILAARQRPLRKYRFI